LFREQALATRLEDVEAYLFPFIQTCLPTSAPLANFLNANFLINIPGWTQQVGCLSARDGHRP
jgi:hypothetical protein